MQKIGLLTDSTASLSPQIVEQYGIRILPLKVHWLDETYRDGVDLTPSAFYARLVQEERLPTTSQPSVQEFRQAFEEMAAHYEGIVAPLISSGISGTVANALAVARDFDAVPIEIVDTHITSAGQALSVMAAARVASEGGSLQEVRQAAEEVAARLHTYFVVDTLEYLHRGGRIGGASRYLATALKIKPILYFNEKGEIDAFERVRTMKKALRRLAALVEEHAAGRSVKIGVMHANAPDVAADFIQSLARRVDLQEVFTVELSPVIGTHVGPGTIGVSFYSEI